MNRIPPRHHQAEPLASSEELFERLEVASTRLATVVLQLEHLKAEHDDLLIELKNIQDTITRITECN